MERSNSRPFGLVGLCRRYFDRVVGDQAAGSPDEIKAARLRLFMVLGVMSSSFYALHDFSLGSYWTAGLHSVAFALLSVSAILLRGTRRLRVVSHLVVTVLTLLLGLIPLWDGHIHAPGLWPLVVVVVSAPFLFRSETVLRYSLVSAGMVLVNLALGPYFDHLDRITQTDSQWLQLRIITLLMFGGLILIGGTSSIRARRAVQSNTEALRARAREEDVAQRSKSVFLATMSHELQTPVSALLHLVQQLRSSTPSPALQESFDGMSQSSMRLSSMLDAVLDLARLETGSVELCDAPFSVGVLLERLHCEFSSQAEQKGLCLRVADGLGPVRLQGDVDRIYQVVAALVDNAIKFSASGKIEVHASREITAPSESSEVESLVVQVVDEGIGMNESQLGRLFGQFEQVHEDEALQRGGCGLGLAVSQRLVRLMGGSLEVESRAGQGSVFTCRLQLAKVNSDRVETDFSTVLGLDFLKDLGSDILPLDDPDGEHVQAGDPELGRFLMVIAPLILAMTVRALFAVDVGAAILQACCLAGLAMSATRTVGRRLGAGAWTLFISMLTLSVGAQSVMDGSIRSEALWSVSLPPIIVAYVFGLRHAALAVFGASGLIVMIAWGLLPQGNFELAQDSVLFTVASRFAFLLAFVGATMLITAGSRAKIVAMQKLQTSVRELSLAAERANQEKSRFFVRIAEEFGAPLRSTLDVAGSHAIRRRVGAEQAKWLEDIDRCARAIFCLLDRALLSAGAAYAADVDPDERFDLRRVIDDTCLLFRNEAQCRGIELLVDDAQLERSCIGDCARVLELLTLLMSYSLSSASSGPLVVSVNGGALGSRRAQDLTIELRFQVGRSEDPLQTQIQSRRESTWGRALEIADRLGGTLRAFDTGTRERWIQLTMQLQAAPAQVEAAAASA